MSQGTPKKHKLEADQGPLEDTVRSSLVLEDEEKWRGKELLLIQIPNNVSPWFLSLSLAIIIS